VSDSKHDPFDHALQTAHAWLADVAGEFGTEDRRFAFRVLRAWLHSLRDRLTVTGAASFAAQLPELLRGVFYDGWEPSRVPVKYGPDEYVLRFAEEARIPVGDVRRAAATVTRGLAAHLSPGQLSDAFAQLPRGLRSILGGSDSSEPSLGGRATGERLEREANLEADTPSADVAKVTASERLQRLETQVSSLIEALSVLARSLEEVPGEEPDKERGAKAARLAYEILLTTKR
jgi:uncharacterized protein (DUF2267 family)